MDILSLITKDGISLDELRSKCGIKNQELKVHIKNLKNEGKISIFNDKIFLINKKISMGSFLKNVDLNQIVLSSVIFCLLFLVYYYVGLEFKNVLSAVDVLFDADSIRVVQETSMIHDSYWRTIAHPLIVLFINPIGRLINNIINSAINSSILLNAAFGSLNIVLFQLVLKKLKFNTIPSLLISLILGFSTSHLLFNSIVETYSYSCAGILSIILIYLNFQSDNKFILLFTIASVISVGFNIINVFIVFIVLFFKYNFINTGSLSHFDKNKLLKFLSCSFFIFFSIIALMFIQGFFYPSTTSSLNSDAVGSDLSFYTSFFLDAPLASIIIKLPSFFIYNILGPSIKTITLPHTAIPGLDLSFYAGIDAIRIVLAIPFVYFSILSLIKIIKKQLYKNIFFIMLLVYFLINVVFFTVYGKLISPILYSEQYTFALLILLSFFISDEFDIYSKNKSSINKILCILLICVFVNNILFLQSIFNILL